MTDDIKQQLNFGMPILNMALRDGYQAWDFSGNIPSGGSINVIGRTFNYEEMCQYALECKRAGKYAESIGGYIRVISECKKTTGKLYISVIRSYIKVLISVNAFYPAFSLVGTALADMQQASNVNEQEFQLFMGYFQNLIELSKMVIDHNDFSAVKGFSANYSGSSNYQLQCSLDEIREQFAKIRAEVRQVYGELLLSMCFAFKQLCLHTIQHSFY